MLLFKLSQRAAAGAAAGRVLFLFQASGKVVWHQQATTLQPLPLPPTTQALYCTHPTGPHGSCG